MKENNKITLKEQEYNLIIKTNSASITSKNNAGTYKRQKFRGIKNKLQVVALLGGCCQECGYKDNLAALEFHHKDPTTKLFNLDARNLANLKWEAITEEANKCKLLCANCHRVEHNPDLFMCDLMNPLVTTEFIPDDEIKGYFVRIQHKNPIPHCQDCGVKLSARGCKRCDPCSRKHKSQIHRDISEQKQKKENLTCKIPTGISCTVCGTQLKESSAKLCIPCYKNKQAAQSKKIPKQDLEKLLWEYPITTIGLNLGVSDNAVRKWCKSYAITNLPPSGYFLTKEFKNKQKCSRKDLNF